jgi:hypothetical protein
LSLSVFSISENQQHPKRFPVPASRRRFLGLRRHGAATCACDRTLQRARDISPMIIASAQLDSSVLPTAARQVAAENALLSNVLGVHGRRHPQSLVRGEAAGGHGLSASTAPSSDSMQAQSIRLRRVQPACRQLANLCPPSTTAPAGSCGRGPSTTPRRVGPGIHGFSERWEGPGLWCDGR